MFNVHFGGRVSAFAGGTDFWLNNLEDETSILSCIFSGNIKANVDKNRGLTYVKIGVF